MNIPCKKASTVSREWNNSLFFSLEKLARKKCFYYFSSAIEPLHHPDLTSVETSEICWHFSVSVSVGFLLVQLDSAVKLALVSVELEISPKEL